MSSEKPHISNPVVGYGGTAYEGHDVKAGVVIWSLVIVAALVVAGFVLMLGVQKYLEVAHTPGELASPLTPERVIPESPQLQVHPWEDLPEMRATEEKGLTTTGRDQAGRMHIPIDAAMTAVLLRLKIDPNAQKGLTTPGGQGREYSHTASEAQAAVRPAIEGEIRKNAQ